ncbi:SDR family oxidoreductase [Enterobacteriaceae bacterium 4M9]|nr:SDR family oxidoreductase [Enterobacteriaceae bacterium 4M9]
MSDVVMVTGAAAGLGREMALHFLREGWRVALADLSEEAAQTTLNEAGEQASNGMALALDIREETGFSQALAQVTEHFGELHALVNNAALTLTTPIMDISVAEFDRVLTTNLRGTFLGCQTVGRYFAQRGYGRIVNLASLAGQNGGTASGAHYAASKGGILTLTKVFARVLAKDGVTVNAIAPGPLDLPSVRAAVPDENMPALLAMIPVAKLGSPGFVARTAALLASRQAEFVTGAAWDINGGIYMR